jgi:hypothetical protein
MSQTRRKKMAQTRRKKMRTKMHTKKRKGGAPTTAQLKKASKGLTRKSRPPPLKISKSSSPSDRRQNVYNPLSPTHKKRLFEIKKQKMINNPLDPSYHFEFIEIYEIPEYMNQDTLYFFINDDETKEIFEFGMNDTKLKPTGYAYINRDSEWKQLKYV